MSRPQRTCATCQQTRPHHCRGLCAGCYWNHIKNGTINQHPSTRPQHPANEVVENVEWLTQDGATHHTAAQRLGMTWTALERALYRANRADLIAKLKRAAI